MNSSTGSFQGLFLLFRNIFLKKHLSVGASGNKKKYNELKKQHKPNKNAKYSTQFFEEYLKTSVLCISVKITLQVSSAIKTKQPSQALIYCI